MEKRVLARIAELEPLVAAGYVRKDSKGIYRPTDEARKVVAAARQERLDIEAEQTGKPATRIVGDDHFPELAHREELAGRVVAAAVADPDFNDRSGGEDATRGDMYGNHLAAELGYDGLPEVVTPDRFAEMKRDRQFRVELFRGVGGGNFSMPDDEVHREWRVGRYRAGLGTFGNGTYMAVRRAHAAEYGTVGRFGLRRDARVITWDELMAEFEPWVRDIRQRSGQDYPDDLPEWTLYGDPGRYAMARGYDAIFVPKGTKPPLGREAGGDQYVILNRTAIVTEVPPVVDATEEALQKLTRAELWRRAGGDLDAEGWSKPELIALILRREGNR